MTKALIARDVESQVEEPEEPVNACKKTCSNWFDKNFFKSVISVKDIFCPISWKKPLWWGGATIALGGVIAIEVTTGAFSTAAAYNNIAIMAVLYAVDPVVQTINILAAKYPPALAANVNNAPVEPRTEGPESIELQDHSARRSPYSSAHNSDDETVYDYIIPDEPVMEQTSLEKEMVANRLRNKDVGIFIPAHLAGEKLAETIRSALIHVHPHQIFIIDNGNSNEPMDNTREIAARISTEITYVWGHKGNKTYAQLIATILANDIKYIYTSDDDMRIPRYFSFGTERINDKVKAVCYAIRGIHPEPGETNWWIRAQSLEYTLSDCAKLAQDRFGDVLYPHGAAQLWERETFYKVLCMHTAIFYAEDVQLGMLLQRLGYAMTIEAGACLDTVAPTSLFGSNPNFVEQRGRSWEMGRQSNYFKFLYQLFCVAPPTKSPINFVMHKFAEAYAVYTNTVDWMRFPLFLLMLRNPDYWIRLAIVTGAGYLPILGWNYIKLPINHRQDLQAGLLDILTYPIFKLIESAMSIYGIGRLIAVYGPNYVHKPTVKEFENSFRVNPVTLADEIHADSLNPKIPPVTYKTIMYNRFFKPAIGNEEIERAFDDNTYALFQDAIIDDIERDFTQHTYPIYPSIFTHTRTANKPNREITAATELGTLSAKANPMYQLNPLEQDNPLFEADASANEIRLSMKG